MLPGNFWADERELLYELLFPIVYKCALDGAASGMEMVGIGLDWALVSTAARDWASAYTYDLVNGITDTSAKFLQKALADWIESGAPLDALIDELAASGMFGPIRAEMIAVTEVTRSFHEGNHAAWVASGVVDGEEWQTAFDDIVCTICAPMQGMVKPLNDPTWPGGLTIPGHIRCRCWAQPKVNLS